MSDIFQNANGTFTPIPKNPLVREVPKSGNIPTNKPNNPNHQQEQLDKYFTEGPSSTRDIDGKGQHIDFTL